MVVNLDWKVVVNLTGFSNVTREIYKMINSVKGLKEYYKLAGSPKMVYPGNSTSNERGYTENGGTSIYNGALITNYTLASTIFHELTHAYQDIYYPKMIDREAERQAYSTEWRLSDNKLRMRVENDINFFRSVWFNMLGNQPSGFIDIAYPFDRH